MYGRADPGAAAGNLCCLAEDWKSWHIMPSDAHISVLEKLGSVLQPLHFLTDALSGEQEVTASAIRPILKHIEEICSVKDDDSPLTKEIKCVIFNDLSTRYNSVFMDSLLDKCTLLDPRFKADFVKDKDLVLSNLEHEIMGCSYLDELAPVHPVDSSDDQPSISEPPVKKAKVITAVLNHILPKVQPQRETLTLAQHCEREIHSYLEQPVVDSEYNPLHWWRDQNKNFPLLSKIAKSIFVYQVQAYHLNEFSAREVLLSIPFVVDCQQVKSTV